MGETNGGRCGESHVEDPHSELVTPSSDSGP